jgi:hypothetical protein
MVKDNRPLISQHPGGGFSQQSVISTIIGRPIHLNCPPLNYWVSDNKDVVMWKIKVKELRSMFGIGIHK